MFKFDMWTVDSMHLQVSVISYCILGTITLH
jgi:hypothetical protein